MDLTVLYVQYSLDSETLNFKPQIQPQITVLTKSAKAAGGLTFRAQLKGMKRVLRRLGTNLPGWRV